MALGNIQEQFQYTQLEVQELIAEIAANYGSIAFMYAKQIYNGGRTIDHVPDRVKDSVIEVTDYVETNKLTIVFE